MKKSICFLLFVTFIIVSFGHAEELTKEANKLFRIIQNGKYGYIDKTGKIIISPQFDMAYSFEEGLGLVKKGAMWGYIDNKGTMIIEPQFSDASPFSQGLASIKIGGDRGKWGYINKKGEIIINPKFDLSGSFSEGLAYADNSFIDKTGHVVIHLIRESLGNVYSFTDRFSEGLAPVVVTYRNSYKWGFINKAGEMIIEPQFDSARSFSGGLARVWVGDKIGFINTSGKFVINPIFDAAFDFSEGLAPVRIEDKWGYIDNKGEIIINPKFDVALPFSEGLAEVYIDRKIGYINKTGNFIWSPTR